MARYTPWGIANTVDFLSRGISIASTDEADCLLISCALARRQLSAEAKKKAVVHGTHYAFHFDEALNYVLVDSDLVLREVAKYLSDDPFALFESAIHQLSRTDPEYLLSLELVPNRKEYAMWKAEKKRSELEALNSPDLIVSFETKKDRFGVRTADGLLHTVCKKSYDKFCETIGDVSSILVTLSDIQNMEKYKNV